MVVGLGLLLLLLLLRVLLRECEEAVGKRAAAAG